MDDKQLDKLFRETLFSHSSPVEREDELWEEIAVSLNKKESARKTWRRKSMFYALSGAVAVLIIALFLFVPSSPKYPLETSQTTAEVVAIEKIQEPKPKVLPAFQPKKQPVVKKLINEGPDTLARHVIQVSAPKTESESQRTIPDVGEEIRIVEDLFGAWGDEGDDNALVGKKKTKYLLALSSNFATGNNSNAVHNVSQRMLMAAGQSGLANGVPVMEQVSETKYSLPLNLGVQFQIRISSLLAVGAGVNYSRLRSKYDGLVDKKMSAVQQTLHYIGVPVNLYATIFQKNGFFIYANVGGTLEKGVSASYVLKSYDETTRYHTAIDGMQFSVNFGLGAEYRFIKQLGLYVEPNAVYFFNSKVPNSIRTDQPFQLKAEIGFRLHL